MDHHHAERIYNYIIYKWVIFSQGCFSKASTMVAPKVLEQLLSAYDAREAWRLGSDLSHG